MSKPFADRADAGRTLASELAAYSGRSDVIVLGLPRGGVPVAYEVAVALGAPLDVFLVRKLGAPGQEELAMGAIAQGGVVVINDEVVRSLRIPSDEVRAEVESERRELGRRELMYRGGRPPLNVEGKVVILIDDGLATGSTMRAAIAALRKQRPASIVVAVPIGAASTCAEFGSIADECVCAVAPKDFRAVGLWYEDFVQTDDEEVCALLDCASARQAPASYRPSDVFETGSVRGRPETRGDIKAREQSSASGEDVSISVGDRRVTGRLSLPRAATGVVAFAHGSGSGRLSPRNQFVAGALNDAGLGTLLIDLLEENECHDRGKILDIELLAGRLQGAADWLASQPETVGLPLGYFGASTGAGAALLAAARAPHSVAAIVSRGGRPDLARSVLPLVTAPTRLIVGGNDEVVIELNREALELLKCPRQLDIVPGASHLFTEPGALDEVARLTEEWFIRYLVPSCS